MNESNNYGEISAIIEGRGAVIYPTRYEEKYNVYTVRACTTEEFGFFPTYIDKFPKRTLECIKADYCLTTGKKPEELDTKISYNKSKYRSVVSFEGKMFSWKQVDDIFEEKDIVEEEDDEEEIESAPARARKR